MSTQAFKIRNTVVVNTAFWANSTGIYFGVSPTLAINATNFTGTSYNANNLNSVPASSYVNTSGSYTLSGVITFNANALFSAGLRANGNFGTANQLLSSNSTGGIYWITPATSTYTDTTNATNISTGTLNSALLGAPGANTEIVYNNSGAMGGVAALNYIGGTANNITVTGQATGAIPLTVKGAASATANLFQVANSGSVVFAINSTGVIVGNGAGLTSVPSNVLLANGTGQTITGGAYVTAANLGVSNSSVNNYTINCGSRPLQVLTANLNTTITAPSIDGSIILLIKNGVAAGTLTFSGFSTTASNTGDPYVNTNAYKFMIPIIRIDSLSNYQVIALQ